MTGSAKRNSKRSQQRNGNDFESNGTAISSVFSKEWR